MLFLPAGQSGKTGIFPRRKRKMGVAGGLVALVRYGRSYCMAPKQAPNMAAKNYNHPFIYGAYPGIKQRVPVI